MKKLSLSLIAAVTFAIGTVSFAIPTQATVATKGSVATIITPEIQEGYYYQHVYFDTYPPEYYEGGNGFVGYLQKVTEAPYGGYYGDYYGHDVNF